MKTALTINDSGMTRFIGGTLRIVQSTFVRLMGKRRG
jgi:hypothetical protein